MTNVLWEISRNLGFMYTWIKGLLKLEIVNMYREYNMLFIHEY